MKNITESSFEERLELYFEWAVTAWLLLKDEAGLIAALAAGKTFNSTDRQIVVTILDNLHTEWSTQDSDNLFKETIKNAYNEDIPYYRIIEDYTVITAYNENLRVKAEALFDRPVELQLNRVDSNVFKPGDCHHIFLDDIFKIYSNIIVPVGSLLLVV